LSKWQLKVKTNVKEGESVVSEETKRLERAFPGITKLITRGVRGEEGSRVIVTGEIDKEERSKEGLSTDQTASPLDCRSMVPMTFSFEFELILMIEEAVDRADPPMTLSFSNGESVARMVRSKFLSHFRFVSPDVSDLPLNTSLNTSPSLTSCLLEEFTRIITWEEEVGDRTSEPSQEGRKDGEVWKQLHSKSSPVELSVFSS
jgi:hypothetical protein